ncbi:MAG: hypothetical protein ACK4I8_01100 [Armatimonadota bacterium]
MAQSLISELAQRLGKSEEEVLRFFQTLWQVMPPSPETQPYFFRYLDERFLRLEDRYTTLRQEVHQQIEALRKEMQQGDANLMRQIEMLRKEMKHNDALLRQEIEALRRVERVEKWLFALTVLILVSTFGILVLLFKHG